MINKVEMTSEMSSGGKYKEPAGHGGPEGTARILIRGESSLRSCQPAGVGCKDCSLCLQKKKPCRLVQGFCPSLTNSPLWRPNQPMNCAERDIMLFKGEDFGLTDVEQA